MYFSVPRHKFYFIKCYSLIPRYKSFIPRYTGLSHNFQYVSVLEKFPDATSIPKYKCIPSNTNHAKPANPYCDKMTFGHFSTSDGFGIS